MTQFPLNSETTLEVPSLGFGPQWRPARRLLGALTRLRRLGMEPATPLERLAAFFGWWRGEEHRLEQENRAWRTLFTLCQRRAGYTRREIAALLDHTMTYAHRPAYEQILLHGEAPLDFRGKKKPSAPVRTPASKNSSSPSSSNTSNSSTTASSPKASSPRPTATSSAPLPNPACAPSSAFWIRRSPSPTPKPAAKC